MVLLRLRIKVTRPLMTSLIRFALALVVFVLAGFAIATAHPAPSGWNYPPHCCHNQDCVQISDDAVMATQGGWGVKATGEVIPYDAVQPSPDGSFHRCSPRFADTHEIDRTICLFVPPQDF
jgi:hypothetical protein